MANYGQTVYNRSCNISKLAVFRFSSFIHTLYVPNSNTFEKMRNIPNELTSVGRCSFVPGRRRLYPPFEVLHLQVMPFFQRRSFVQERVLQIRH